MASRSRTPEHHRRLSLSPQRIPRRGRNSGGLTVIKEASASVQYPMLTKSNYPEWVVMMRINLQAQGLWRAIDPGNASYGDDRLALAAIARSVPTEMITMVGSKETAKAAWEAIKTVRMGVERVRESNAQKLRRDFNNITFKDGESVDDFSLRISNLASNLRLLGDDIQDKEVVKKMMQVIPDRLTQVAISIKTLLDVGELSLEEVTGRFRAADERLDARARNAEMGSRLMLTSKEEDLIKRLRRQEGQRGGGGGGGGAGASSGGAGSSGTSAPPRSGAPPGKSSQEKPKAGKNDCRYCGKRGHWARECRKKKRDEAAAAALLTEEAAGDDEPALMMAQVVMAEPEQERVQERVAPIYFGGQVFLNETHATAYLGDAGDRPDDGVWYLDTGASNHMTGNGEAFCELNRDVTGQVKFGDGSTVDIVGRGVITFAARGGGHRTLTDVYYIPRLRSNIISLGQLDEDGCQVVIGHGVLRVRDPEKELLVKVPRSTNRLYKAVRSIARPAALLACAGDDTWRWHERYGHLGFDGLKKLTRGAMVRGLPQLDHPDQLCEVCLAGKQRRGAFPKEAKYRAKERLDLVHGDLCGPVSPATHGGRRYFLLLVDDVSRYMWLVLLTRKDEAADTIKKFQAGVEVETGRKLRALRTDRGGEFTAVTFGEYCTEKGVHRQLTAPYSPQQNGVVERRNQTVMAMARCLLKARKVPGTFWGEAASTAVFLLNRSPTKSVTGKTPYEAWHGEKPAVQFLRTFGCIAHVKVTRPHGGKLDDRSIKMVFVGYEPGSKAYRVYDPVAGRLHVSRDIIFDEAKGWPWEETGEAHCDTFTVEYTVAGTIDGVPQATTPEGSAHAGHYTEPPHVDPEPELEEDEAPRRYRNLSDCIAEAQPRTLHPDEWLLTATEEPSTYDEAATDPAWRAAMEEEMQAIEANGTWEAVELPAGHRPIGLKWVYKLKKDAQGIVVRHKARLVAKGYVQRAGVDFEEVFAPVARLDSVRALAALAAHEGWKLHHLDVKSAFLNGDLKEEVYVAQPPGFVIAGQERRVLRLHKALYGLRQAPRAWNAKLDRTLVALGFKRCEEEHGVYTRGEGRRRVLLGVYVDDLILTGAEDDAITSFKDEMKSSFKMSDLGCLSYYLGIEVKQDEGRITLCQAAYAAKLLDKAGMAGCNTVHTPMETGLKLSKDSPNPPVDATFYRSIVGSLRYLVHTRPDITFAVGMASRFMASPTTEHMSVVKHLLRYIAGTIHYGLVYNRQEGGLTLCGYSDSDMAGDMDGRRSTSGVLYCLGRSPVSWQSQKQSVVALSSCEAEYIAASTAACQGIWLGRLLGSFYGKSAGVVTIYIDNQSSIQLCKNPVFHGRSKHIETRFHFIRDCVEGGQVTVRKIHTDDQLADILTKALGKVRFQVLRSKLGVVDVRNN
ncbi:hypothetical protein U9M48_030605 [Paspalum notatum var. saurae]|uniref:Gag-pol polyprotein n=1 Tax=Paspalum notatum var. saurae TaxID=547442 RepID=A0AAQ3U0S9_PASNO